MKSVSILPIAGILGIGAIIYIYLKQRDKDKRKKPSEKDEKKVDNNDTVVETLEFKIINAQVPNIVGRNALNLKSIEEKTKTTIRFREYDGDHQICMIKGRKKNDVMFAKQLIDVEQTKPSVITDELLVSTSSYGKIEGYCGSVLHEICQKSSAKVWVDPLSTRKSQGENRRVLITGTKEQVEFAKKLIEEKITEPSETLHIDDKKDEFKRSPRASLSPFGSNSSITATETLRECLLPSPERFSKNNDGTIKIFVSACATPSRFWVQLCGQNNTELDFLVDAMTEYYNQKENQEIHQIREPYLGQIVAAMYLADNKWYRAEIVAIQPNESNDLVLDVYFLDYGDQQYVGKRDILELRADFLSLRFQAIECFLAHVQPKITGSQFEEWDRKSIEAFESLVQVAQWKKLISKVVTYKERKSFASQQTNQRESSPVPGIELYEEDSDKNIALELVRMGHAEISDRFGDLAKSSVLVVNQDEKEDKVDEETTLESKKEVTFKPINELIEIKELSPEPKEILTPQPELKQKSINDNSSTEKEDQSKISTQVSQESSETINQNQVSNNNNNLDPLVVTNGKSLKPSSANLFGESNNTNSKQEKLKKKKHATANFLKHEQANASKNSDWNAMMEE
ncbi:hypothetical protein PVAND_004262 [Polypedilum vanderplanki]|uniref:Tudor domain-containing protein n=1 Tax=Polypedilum vanderplanki TaxID=319348 RepID=A0A9J6BXK8_POLVA|nr:hypothetical protein PVAND_004262 [Polypedilum vanderplanki]